jgi:ribonuclease T1
VKRRRTRNPAVLIAVVIAVAVVTWFQREDTSPRNDPRPPAEAAGAPQERQAQPESQKRPVEPQERTRDSQERTRAASSEQAEIAKTLALIERGGPFPYEKDGTVFANREKRLPLQPRGYYREYTVRTPGAPNRGARRIVRGQSGETWYTRDHYRTFIRIDNDGHATSDH